MRVVRRTVGELRVLLAVSTKSLAALGSRDLAQAFKVLPRFARLRNDFSELLYGFRKHHISSNMQCASK